MSDSLLDIVKDLQERVKKLEEDNAELKKWVCKEKKKINIIAWLNEHYLPSNNFSEWLKGLKVNERELELVFTYRLEKGSYYIIEQHLPLEDRKYFPIMAFKHQRKSTFYVYEEKSWRKIKKGEFASIVKNINHKLFKAFNTWEKVHPEMRKDENRTLWAKQLQRILLPPEKLMPIVDRLEKRLHSYLALNLKNIMEYEFIF